MDDGTLAFVLIGVFMFATPIIVDWLDGSRAQRRREYEEFLRKQRELQMKQMDREIQEARSLVDRLNREEWGA